MVLVGKKAPNFKANAVFKGEVREISLSDYKNKYVVLFFYPLDFTFVCPTEMHAFQAKLNDFKAKGVELLGCSVDSQFSHIAWLETEKNKGGIKGIEYGLISDLGGKIAQDYDVLNEENVAYRGAFLIDKEGVVRSQIINDLPIGRNINEILRIVDALQHHETHGQVCPANWSKGDEAIEATAKSVSDYLTNLVKDKISAMPFKNKK